MARSALVIAVFLNVWGRTTAANCAQDGTGYSYTESVSGSTRTIVTNHCPNHPQKNLNPNYAVSESTTYTLPASPTYVGAATDSSTSSANIDLSESGGGNGVLFNGAFLFSPYGGMTYGQVTGFSTSATYAEGNTFDQCGCHPSQTDQASYHCHVPPSCLLQQLGQSDSAHSPQVGWAFDGFPVYGPRGPDGTMMKTCTQTGGTYGTSVCTDDCGGYYLDDGSIDEFVYRYYIQGTYNDGTSCDLPGCPSPTEEYYPNTPVCFRGCCPVGSTCESGITSCHGKTTLDGYTSDYTAAVPTVNSLSLASGLPTNCDGCAYASLACASSTCSSQGWSNTACGTGGETNPGDVSTSTCSSATTTTTVTSDSDSSTTASSGTSDSDSSTTASTGTSDSDSNSQNNQNSQSSTDAASRIAFLASISCFVALVF